MGDLHERHAGGQRPSVSALEAYLRQATRGVPRRHRGAVRAEIEEHILIRTAALQLGGMSEQDALQHALRQLGAPHRLHRGFVHAVVCGWARHPVVRKKAAVGGVAGGAVVALVALTLSSCAPAYTPQRGLGRCARSADPCPVRPWSKGPGPSTADLKGSSHVPMSARRQALGGPVNNVAPQGLTPRWTADVPDLITPILRGATLPPVVQGAQ